MIENKNWEKNKNQLIIGADEVGRGSLAGPIVGAAVKLKFLDIDLLSDVRDSKKISPKKIIDWYGSTKPLSGFGKMILGESHIMTGNKEKVNSFFFVTSHNMTFD